MTPTLSALSALATEHASVVREMDEIAVRLQRLATEKAQIELHARLAGVALDARTQNGEVKS